MSEKRDEEIPALTKATDDLRTALAALELAKAKHPRDTYLQGQAREHVWLCYWALRAAANDSPKPATAYDHLRKGLEAEIDRYRKSTDVGDWQRADRLEALLAEEEK